MDPIKNPFSPGAGSPPPELVGRDEVLEQARVACARILAGRNTQFLMLTGLRGVGKTVLLNEIRRIAKSQGYHALKAEAHEDKPIGALLAPSLRALLLELDRLANASSKVKRGLSVLLSFATRLKMTVGDVTFGLDVEPAKGTADSGDIETDLPALFAAIGEAAADRKTGVILLLDEIQFLNERELGALIMAMHEIQQQQLPLMFAGAGLPILPALAGNSKSYAERLFLFPDIGPLSMTDSAKALNDPTVAQGVSFQPAALKEIYRLTKGYAYFLQEWGSQVWNHASKSPITLIDVQEATPKAIERLDKSFFRVRYDRLTSNEKKVLRAMAKVSSGPMKIGALARELKIPVTSLGPVRASLIKKGMIFSPGFGDIAFTVPMFDQYMKRVMPDV